jgi:uncharacterized membrane protein
MTSGRLEAFSDAVVAIIITIMVLELAVPDESTYAELRHLLPVFLAYVLSFVNLGIYWNNHHHMLVLVERVNGRILWANLHLLFWLSLFPFATGWMGEHGFAALPVAVYGGAALAAAIAYYILVRAIISDQGEGSRLAAALGRDIKGKISPLFYIAGIVLAPVNRWISLGLYVFVALMWFIPDRRIESTIH